MPVEKGIDQGRHPELVGGGLIRSLGGWSAVKALRRTGNRELSDERILGSGEFVEQIIKEAENQIKYQLPLLEQKQRIDEFILIIFILTTWITRVGTIFRFIIS